MRLFTLAAILWGALLLSGYAQVTSDVEEAVRFRVVTEQTTSIEGISIDAVTSSESSINAVIENRSNAQLEELGSRFGFIRSNSQLEELGSRFGFIRSNSQLEELGSRFGFIR
ncbi:MAG: hypothetical protein Kow0098_21580 [Ignavibacteriaceae bacterium]